MKLAEALIEKKNLSARIGELQGRYTAAAVIEEGAEPDETADELLTSLHAAFSQWEDLTVAINLANNKILVGEKTMMQALAHRDILKTQISHFNNIAGSIRQRNQQRRFYNTEGPKMVVAEGVDVKYFIKLVDTLSKELRELDLSIQAANWANELTA
jgi:molybdopterin converting factor small subunit